MKKKHDITPPFSLFVLNNIRIGDQSAWQQKKTKQDFIKKIKKHKIHRRTWH